MKTLIHATNTLNADKIVKVLEALAKNIKKILLESEPVQFFKKVYVSYLKVKNLHVKMAWPKVPQVSLQLSKYYKHLNQFGPWISIFVNDMINK